MVSPAAPWRVSLHPDVDSDLDALDRAGLSVRRKVAWTLLELASHGQTSRVKGAVGQVWRRPPVAGNAHYLYRAPRGATDVGAAQRAPKEILVRAVREHDLAPVELALLVSLAALRKAGRATRVFVCGDASQTLRPTAFTWGTVGDLAFERLGVAAARAELVAPSADRTSKPKRLGGSGSSRRRRPTSTGHCSTRSPPTPDARGSR